MTRKQKRLSIIAAGAVFLAGAVALVTSALREQIVFFNSPSDVLAQQLAPGTRVRLGGLVEQGSVVRGENSTVTFQVTDTKASVKVTYAGILPDLFREGQGVVTEGTFSPGEGTFMADSVLAKHDENYMPKEVAAALKAQGVWQEGDPTPGVGAAKSLNN